MERLERSGAIVAFGKLPRHSVGARPIPRVLESPICAGMFRPRTGDDPACSAGPLKEPAIIESYPDDEIEVARFC
jgi:hypothetical protein